MKKKLLLTMLMLSLSSFVLLNTFTNAKYYNNIITQILETNFAAFNVVDPGNEKFYYSIGGQSSDNEASMFDGDATLIFDGNNATSYRWTNWLESGANKGEQVTIVISFVSPVTISTMRLYYFVDHVGCDLPLAVSLSYIDYDTNKNVELYSNAGLESVDKNIDVATDDPSTPQVDPRDSIFRQQLGNNCLHPVYYMDKDGDGTKENTRVTASSNYASPYSILYFNKDSEGNVNRVRTQQLTLIMHTAPDWYMGFTEIAMDWSFINEQHREKLGDSPWYGII